MANKLDTPNGLEPIRIPVGHINSFRVIVLVFLGLFTICCFLLAPYLALGVLPDALGILFLFFFTICVAVFATVELVECHYRRLDNMLHADKITTKVPVEYVHADRKGSTIIMQVKSYPNPEPFWVQLNEYQAQKRENQNIAIFGMNGTGKTLLLKCVAKQIDPSKFRVKFVSFKRKDRGISQELHYDRKNMRLHRVDPWSSKDAFKRSLLVAMDLDESVGITANAVRPLVEELIDESNSWEELFVELKLAISNPKESSLIQKGALLHIQHALKAIYDPNAEYFDITHTSEFLDYSTESETRATFDAEFFLDVLYDKIVTEELRNTVIIIDEAHRLLKNKYENGRNASIIEKLITREIRATGSRIYLCSQLYTDISPGARDQFASQYLFRTKDPETLSSLHAISELLDQAVVDLDPYHFVDIGQDYRGVKVRDYVFHFKLYPREVETIASEPAAIEEPSRAQEPVVEEEEEEEPTSPLQPAQGYFLKVIEMLEDGPLTTQEIAIQLAIEEKKAKDAREDWKPSSKEINAKKLELTDKKVLRKLISVDNGDLTDVLLLQDEYRDKPKSLYYLKEKCNGEKQVHARLTAITKEKLLKHYDASKIIEGKDRVDVADFEIPGFVIEVETGLRRGNFKDLEDRIKAAKQTVLIVVPHDRTKEEYKHFVENGRVKVLVLYELNYYLEKNSPATAKETA